MYWAIEKNAMDKILAIIAASDKIKQPEYSSAQTGHAVSRNGSVAIIPIVGTLMKNPNIFEKLFFGAVDMAEIADAINTAAADKGVLAIVLNISSPGGTVAGTADLAAAVRTAKEKKKCVAFVDDLAASAAYWIAAQAESIYANKEAVIGSIGVRMAMYDMSEAYKQAGIKVIPVDTGKFKSAGLAGTEITDEQRQMYQDIIDAHFIDFEKAVKNGRASLEWDAVKDAQIYHARKAKSVGLIDGVSTLVDVIKDLSSKKGRATGSASAKMRILNAGIGMP